MSLPTSNATIAWQRLTAPSAGAIAVLQLVSTDRHSLNDLIRTLTLQDAGPIGSITHRALAGLDDGVVVRTSDQCAIIMPHGGTRIVAALTSWLSQSCALSQHGPGAAFPEARDDVEALALAAIARGASPRAIPLLLRQSGLHGDATLARWKPTRDSHARDLRLAALLSPARIVAVGAANVGKSSLLNAMAGRTVAIAMDFEGTTRDAVAARVELDGIIVDWFDTPGIRETDDHIERAAQAIAHTLIESASLIVAISAPGFPCPPVDAPAPILRVCTKADLDPTLASDEARNAECRVSGTQRTGLEQLAQCVRQVLVNDGDLDSREPWLFEPSLVRDP